MTLAQRGNNLVAAAAAVTAVVVVDAAAAAAAVVVVVAIFASSMDGGGAVVAAVGIFGKAETADEEGVSLVDEAEEVRGAGRLLSSTPKRITPFRRRRAFSRVTSSAVPNRFSTRCNMSASR